METLKRTVLRTILWRCYSFTLTATAITIYSNDIRVGITIAAILQSIKFISQIWYERRWNKISWGTTLPNAHELQGAQADQEGLPSLSETVQDSTSEA